MAKPKVTLHIFTSLDGRITGDFGKAQAAKESVKLFKRIGFNDDAEESMHFDGWIYGKNTSLAGFGNEVFTFDDNLTVPDGDYITSLRAKRYYIAIDRKGEIGWTKQTASYGGQNATVIEILTNLAGNGYKNFLRRHNIPYLICGDSEVDFSLMLDKLNRFYGLENLMLGGGGILNWSLLDQGLVDEISLVMAPAIDGATNTARVFNSLYDHEAHPISFQPIDLRTYSDGTLWLRYKPIDD